MPISLAIIDVDYLGRLNETFGVAHGDECLRVVADAICLYAKRAGDLAARHEDGKFTLVMGNVPHDKARFVGDRLVEAMRELRIPNPDAPGRIMTVSVGLVTHWPKRSETEPTLMGLAETCLFEAKSDGRNRVAVQSVQRWPRP